MKLIRYEYPQTLGGSAYDSLLELGAPAFARFGPLWGDLFAGTSGCNQTAADLYEDDDNYYARLELPGVKKSDINLELENSVLEISRVQAEGEKAFKQNVNFRGSISVPDGVAFDRVSASHQGGILIVTMPKQEARKPRKIAVK